MLRPTGGAMTSAVCCHITDCSLLSTGQISNSYSSSSSLINPWGDACSWVVAETAGSGWVTLGAGSDVAFAEAEATFGSFGVMVVMASPAQKRAPCPFLPHLVHFFS